MICRHRVGVDVADRELVEVGGEAAARLDLAVRRHDQRLARPLAVVLLRTSRRPTPPGKRSARSTGARWFQFSVIVRSGDTSR